MTSGSGPHLSPDDFDAWLDGTLAAERTDHLGFCTECRERFEAERELVELLGALPLMSPAVGLDDRVMHHVAVPRPTRIRSIQSVRQRLLGGRRAMAVAAGVAVLVVTSMAGSIVWTLGHQATLASIGGWLLTQTGQLGWLAVQGLASNFIEQPWYGEARHLLASPGRLTAAAVITALAYLGGVVALRRLLALPTQQVAHASA